MGNKICVNDKNVNGAQLVEITEAVDDKSPNVFGKPAAIDQQISEPAPPPVQAPAQEQEPEAQLEPDPGPIETNSKSMPMVFGVYGIEMFIINQELCKKVDRLRVRRGPSVNDALAYTIPSVGNIDLKVDVSASQRDWWKVFSVIDKKSGACIGFAGWVIKKVDGTETLSALSALREAEEQTVYIKRKPLGLVINKECPIKIKGFKDASHGREVGIQKGWMLKSLNGDDFTKFTEFKEAMDVMNRHLETLPSTAQPSVDVI